MTLNMPTPPGALGVASSPGAVLSYLGALAAWINQRRSELDSIDSQIIATNRQAELNADIALALAIWQSIKNKENEILNTWDSGRVTQVELEKISTLMWGRLDNAEMANLAVSLPEAGRLCDALVGTLRSKLNTDPGVENQLARLRSVRAGLERIRDQVGLEPAALRPTAQSKLTLLLTRLDDAEEKRSRGADIGGLLDPLESDSAKLERDLIVQASQRREGSALLEDARKAKAQLEGELLSLRALEAQTKASVWPVPENTKLDWESVSVLPNTLAGLKEYEALLASLKQTMIARKRELSETLSQSQLARQLLDSLHARVKNPDRLTTILYDAAKAILEAQPTVLPVLRHAIAAYQARIDYLALLGSNSHQQVLP